MGPVRSLVTLIDGQTGIGSRASELAERSADPWRKKVEGAVRGVEAMSSAALLDLLRVPATTGTARRLAKIMRSMGFIPIKSRRLMPGDGSRQLPGALVS
jgi:hypothetical protein